MKAQICQSNLMEDLQITLISKFQIIKKKNLSNMILKITLHLLVEYFLLKIIKMTGMVKKGP